MTAVCKVCGTIKMAMILRFVWMVCVCACYLLAFSLIGCQPEAVFSESLRRCRKSSQKVFGSGGGLREKKMVQKMRVRVCRTCLSDRLVRGTPPWVPVGINPIRSDLGAAAKGIVPAAGRGRRAGSGDRGLGREKAVSAQLGAAAKGIVRAAGRGRRRSRHADGGGALPAAVAAGGLPGTAEARRVHHKGDGAGLGDRPGVGLGVAGGSRGQGRGGRGGEGGEDQEGAEANQERRNASSSVCKEERAVIFTAYKKALTGA
ncbi:unnamed protein product [Pseudo-nitzschia multistriata]|uniref:Uncharacterized protein n=1 Tax=Pseudo-nitzschia multistriata TaxID=183589 RepID=A0A448YV57_9STRA|nr:unnamed protein product [Pseudo-nitzschia multistriata]